MATKRKGDAAEAGTLSTYGVLSRLDHDNVAYQPGDSVELTEEQAAVLLGLGVITTDGQVRLQSNG